MPSDGVGTRRAAGAKHFRGLAGLVGIRWDAVGFGNCRSGIETGKAPPPEVSLRWPTPGCATRGSRGRINALKVDTFVNPGRCPGYWACKNPPCRERAQLPDPHRDGRPFSQRVPPLQRAMHRGVLPARRALARLMISTPMKRTHGVPKATSAFLRCRAIRFYPKRCYGAGESLPRRGGQSGAFQGFGHPQELRGISNRRRCGRTQGKRHIPEMPESVAPA